MRRVWLLLAAVAVASAACAQGGGGGGGAAPVGAPPEQGGGATVGGAVPSSVNLPPLVPAVIKTADLEVEVAADSIDGAMEEATSVAGRYNGFVLSSSVHDEQAATGSVILRVPAERFDAAMADLRGLGRVRDETRSGEEVSQEFVDLEARLRNLRAQETVLIRLMDRATSIADTIRVQQVLEGVQLDIERFEGRLRYLEDQTALATISLRLVEAGAVVEAGTFGRAWRQAVEGFQSVIAALVVVVGYVLPLAILAAFGALVVRRVLRSRPGPAAGA